MKILDSIEKFLKNNSLFILTMMLFANYFAVERSLYTKIIHWAFYIHLIDLGMAIFVAIFTVRDVYRQLKREQKDEEICLNLENSKKE